MNLAADAGTGDRIDDIYRSESRRVLATLIRLLGDFDLAEDALQDAFTAAAQQWPRDGLPANPRAWLVSTGRFKAIDRLRRRARYDAALTELAAHLDDHTEDSVLLGGGATIEDDRLRLIFICCHPALPADAQVALALREVCGLTTEEIARAFLTGSPTVAQRIVRAKARIRAERIPYEVPSPDEMDGRLDTVLRVIYLIFTEGYAASAGASVIRSDLSDEAIRLGRLLVELLPETEALGLLALMLFQDSRRLARTTPAGDLVLLADQDRRRWDRHRIDEGVSVLARAVASGRVGSFTLQAAIAEVHATALTSAATDWNQVVALYDLLVRLDPSPVVRLNRAVAVAMRDGPEAGLKLIAPLIAGELPDDHLAWSARADLLRRLGRSDESRIAYRHALRSATQEPERRFLEQRLLELDA